MIIDGVEFQSTPPRGWRPAQYYKDRGQYHKFQSTPPRGWRPWTSSFQPFRLYYFNPLHREGGDSDLVGKLPEAAISIHSTARVETDRIKKDSFAELISIHSTARVETHCLPKVCHDGRISIHSTARVETAVEGITEYHRRISIHSTARVETQ